MKERREYARVSTRITGHARLAASLEDEPRFSMANSPASPAASLEGAKLPQPVVKFLLGLDQKLDMLLSQQSLTLVERDYPLLLDIREVSGNGIRFMPTPDVPDNAKLEIVLVLRQAPIRLVAAKGRVRLHLDGDTPSHASLEFTSIRDNDLETLVSFVFEEEREHIRRRNNTGG